MGENEQDVVLLTQAKGGKLYIRASPAMICILAYQKASFFILPTTFSIQTPTDFLFHSLFSLNIIFQCFLFYFVFLNHCFIISPPIWIPTGHSHVEFDPLDGFMVHQVVDQLIAHPPRLPHGLHLLLVHGGLAGAPQACLIQEAVVTDQGTPLL